MAINIFKTQMQLKVPNVCTLNTKVLLKIGNAVRPLYYKVHQSLEMLHHLIFLLLRR